MTQRYKFDLINGQRGVSPHPEGEWCLYTEVCPDPRAKLPMVCVCNPEEWIRGVRKVCAQFTPMSENEPDICKDCEHEEGCHTPSVATKPPLGIMPEYLWLEKRVAELQAVLKRYREAGIPPWAEWVREMARHQMATKTARYQRTTPRESPTEEKRTVTEWVWDRREGLIPAPADMGQAVATISINGVSYKVAQVVADAMQLLAKQGEAK